jgi:hypothetical protein
MRWLPASMFFAVIHAGIIAPASAQNVASPTDTMAKPTGVAIVARALKVTGADTILRQHGTLKVTGVLTQPALNQSSRITTVKSATGEFRMTIEVEGFGDVEQGYADSTAWSMHPQNGVVVLQGAQAAQVRRQAVWLDSPGLYRSLTNTGHVVFDGKDAWAVVAVAKDGLTITRFYDVQTGLAIGSRSDQPGPDGPMQIVTIFTDYKEFGGLKLWTRQLQTINGNDQFITIENVEFDKASKAEYGLPAEVAALRGRE